ncbi:MAG: enoyl-ACP reductase FabI [Spirochaetia bacterium]
MEQSDTRLLEGKTALVFGVANDHSLAWGISRTLYAHGATIALSYGADQLERRVLPLAESIDSPFVEKCDVTDDSQIDRLFSRVKEQIGQVDVLVHAVAFAPREDMEGAFLETSRSGFHVAMDVSVYSFLALARAAAPLMATGGSMLTLTYYGGEKVAPGYQVMGVAKAALESTTRYLAADLGPKGIRVNAISAGPVRTLAAAGVPGFRSAHAEVARSAPMRRAIDIDDVGGAALWLSSDLARNVTGQVVFVDAGHSILSASVPTPE